MTKIINLYKKFNKFIKYIILVLSVTKNFKIEHLYLYMEAGCSRAQ